MASSAKLSGLARKALVTSALQALQTLANDGGLSMTARLGLSMLTGWLAAEHARLEEKYPSPPREL